MTKSPGSWFSLVVGLNKPTLMYDFQSPCPLKQTPTLLQKIRDGEELSI